MKRATDGHWECSRCQSFGQVRSNEDAQCECDEIEDSLRAQLAAMTTALGESIKLQAHYATLLNQYDGGQRTVFSSADEWIARLREIGERPH